MRKLIAIMISIIILGVSYTIIVNGENINETFNLNAYDKLYILSVAWCVFICLFFVLFVKVENITDNESKKKIYNEACEKKQIWLNSYITWMVIHFWSLGSSYLATLIVVYISVGTQDNSKIVLYSILSLLMSVLNVIIRPSKMAYGYRIAYQLIDKALVKAQYLNDDSELADARIKAEEVITENSFD